MKAIDFAQLQKKLQKRTVLALSVETRELSAALLRKDGEEPRTAESLSLPLGADVVLSEPERVGTALATSLEQAKIRERRCVVCIPRRWALCASVELPEISGDDLAAFLELQAERLLSVNPGETRLAHSIFSLPDGKRYATIAAISNRRLDALQKMLTAAGCRAVSISLGLDRSVRLGRSAPSLEFLANCDHVDLVVAACGGVTALRTLPGPKGEKFDPGAFFREVRITLGRLPAPLRRELDTARFAGPEESVATLMQAGSVPLQRLGIAHVETEPAGAVAHPAVDAASAFLREQPVMFDLVTRQPRRWEAALARLDARQQRWIFFGILALVVLPFIVLFVRARIESNLEDEWQRMRSEVSALEGLQQRIRQFRPWYDTSATTLQALETLASCFPEQGDVWARSIQVSDTGKVTCTGLARRQEAFFAVREKLVAKPGVSGFTFQLHNDSATRKDAPGSIQFTLNYQWEAKNAR